MQHVFQVMTDSVHYGELDLHSVLLAELFGLVDRNSITTPLNTADPSIPNKTFVLQFIGTKLKEAFPHLQDSQLQIITQGFFSYTQDLPKFTQHLRDFLVESKEIAGDDMSNVYLVERQQKAAAAEAAKVQYYRDKNITGMINPHDVQDDEMA